jgi:NPCBM/NEW2 domain
VSCSCNRSRFTRPGGLVWRCLGLVLAVVTAPLGFGGPADLTAQPDPIFRALLLDGRTQTGRLVSLGPGAITLASAEGARHELPMDRVFKLTRDVYGSIAALDRSMAIFPEGDRLMRLTLGSATETALDVQSDTLGKVSLPLDSLLGWIMVVPAMPDDVDGLWDRVCLEPRKEEVVWLSNGDRLSGGFLGWDDRALKMLVSNKPRDIDRTGIAAVGFAPNLVNYPRPKSAYLELTLHDGSRFGVSDATIGDGNIEVTARFGQKLHFPMSELVAVHVRSPAFVYLTERKTVKSGYFPYVGPTRELRIDRTVDGHLFELAGQTYDRGIGAQSRTLLAYPIEPGDRRFQALVGVDERAGPLGSVVFRVLVDKEVRYKSQPLSHRDAPQAIDLDLTGGKFLILDTDFGDRGNIRDLADWVEARVVRTSVGKS